MGNKHACMLVGGAGTGKTTVMGDKLRNMDSDQYVYMNINLNCFTDSMLLQGAMESVLEKKTGKGSIYLFKITSMKPSSLHNAFSLENCSSKRSLQSFTCAVPRNQGNLLAASSFLVREVV